MITRLMKRLKRDAVINTPLHLDPNSSWVLWIMEKGNVNERNQNAWLHKQQEQETILMINMNELMQTTLNIIFVQFERGLFAFQIKIKLKVKQNNIVF